MMAKIRETHEVNSVSICLWSPDAYCERQQCVTIRWIESLCYFNDGERAVHMCVYIYIHTVYIYTSLLRRRWSNEDAEAATSAASAGSGTAAEFRPGTIHASCLRQSMCGGLEWMRSALLFAGPLPSRSSNCFSFKWSELTGSPLFSCQYSRK